MKLEVALALICMISPKALALYCYQCLPINPASIGSCTETMKDCPDQCASSTLTTYYGGNSIDVSTKYCAAKVECVSGRLNLGVSKVIFNTKCCSSFLCNTQKLPALPIQSPNGKKCFFCSVEDCSGVVNCEGDEDHCISSSAVVGGLKVAMKGCVSRSICDAAAAAAAAEAEAVAASGMQIPGISADMKCCEGNLCNDAKGLKLSLFLILVPLLCSTILQYVL